MILGSPRGGDMVSSKLELGLDILMQTFERNLDRDY